MLKMKRVIKSVKDWAVVKLGGVLAEEYDTVKVYMGILEDKIGDRAIKYGGGFATDAGEDSAALIVLGSDVVVQGSTFQKKMIVVHPYAKRILIKDNIFQV